MTEELQNKLYTKYPKIFVQHTLPMSQTCMCWGIECGDGWYNLLDDLCSNLQTYVDNSDFPQVEAVQVKEKFGILRFYLDDEDDVIEAFIDHAESISNKTCEICGTTDNVGHTIGWITTCCEACAKDMERNWKPNVY